MKTLFLKNRIQITTAFLAMAGAFSITSMQNSSSAFAPKIGYTLNAVGECNVATLCSDVPSPEICRVSYPYGARAFDKNAPGMCINTLWRNNVEIP